MSDVDGTAPEEDKFSSVVVPTSTEAFVDAVSRLARTRDSSCSSFAWSMS